MVFLILQTKHRDQDGWTVAAAATLVIMMLFVFAAYNRYEYDLDLKQRLLNDISNVSTFEDVTYHKVEYLGSRSVVVNPADGHFYVDLGNGAMISFDRIFIERMCRSCEQFQSANTSEQIHLYRVQREPKGVFNDDEPVLFFSKQQDIYLQSMQSIVVDEQTIQSAK